jgi:hypothetical protein
MSLVAVAVFSTSPALGLKHLPKRQGRPAMHRRRLRKHSKEVVQVPKGERRKGSNKNSYKPDESEYPAYLSGFYGSARQATEAPKEGTSVPVTDEPTYSPTYGYDEAQPEDEYYTYEDGHYDDEQAPGYQNQGQGEQYIEPQQQPQLYYPELDEYPAEEAVYTYFGEGKKQGKKGTTEGKKGTKEGKHAGNKSANKGVAAKYAVVKSYKSKGKKASYYDYAVEEEALHGEIDQDVIIYDNEYEQLHGEIHDGLIGPFPDNVHQEVHEAILEQTHGPSPMTPVPEEYYSLPPKGSKSQKGNPSSKSTLPGETQNPAVKGPKGEQLHSKSKSSSCSKGKGKGKGDEALAGKKKSKSNNNYYYTELLDTESWVADECTSDSTKKSTSGKKSKSQGKSMIEYRKSFAGILLRDCH